MSLRPIALGWNGLQNQFRQQYSKEILGNNYFMHGGHSTPMRTQEL